MTTRFALQLILKRSALICFVCLSWLVECQGQIQFQKTYGGPIVDLALVVCESDSGGYIMGGFTRSYGPGYWNMYLIRTNAYGDTVWTRTYGNQVWNRINWLSETSDGGIIISAFSDYNILLMKTNSNGNILWKRVFMVNQSTGGHSVIETYDHGYALVASMHSGSSGHWNANMFKTDSVGTTQWIKKYDGTFPSHATSVIQTPDSGFVIAGSVYESVGSNFTDCLVIRTDQNGDTLWLKKFGVTDEFDIGYSVANVPGGYIVSGFYSITNSSHGMFLYMMDINGNSV